MYATWSLLWPASGLHRQFRFCVVSMCGLRQGVIHCVCHSELDRLMKERNARDAYGRLGEICERRPRSADCLAAAEALLGSFLGAATNRRGNR